MIRLYREDGMKETGLSSGTEEMGRRRLDGGDAKEKTSRDDQMEQTG